MNTLVKFTTLADAIKAINADKSTRTALIAGIAERQAKIGEPISYSAICIETWLPIPNRNWKNHELQYHFKLLDEEDDRLGRPRRTTMFVCKGDSDKYGNERKRSRLPGNGYFRRFKTALGSKLGTRPQRRKIYLKELAKTIAYYCQF